jgi:undecaprenyl diphosphate synthase
MATSPAPHAGERLMPGQPGTPARAPAGGLSAALKTSAAAAALPRHIAIIMDGNGRWAVQRGLPRIEGHRRGVASVRRITEHCARLGIEQLTLYCLSSENWRRPPHELEFLMHLLEQYMVEERSLLMRERIRLSMIGHREGLPAATLEQLDSTIELCAGNDGLRLCLAINYGSRMEIVDAARMLAKEARDGLIDPQQIDESAIAARLSTAGMPDPDLLIRTAGEMRISNFLLWQISYAELWITDVPWPEFAEPHLDAAIAAFAARDRRFGGLSQS